MRGRLFAFGILFSLLACGQSGKGGFKPPDGHWWLAAMSGQRDGMLTGFYACYTFAQRHPVESGTVGQRLGAKVTDFYMRNPDRLNLEVSEVLAQILAAARGRPLPRFVRPNPKNEPDGDAWRQLYDEREGIVDGFRACQASAGQSVSNAPASALVAWINRWYGIDPADPSALNDKTGNDKLSAVILRAEREVH